MRISSDVIYIALTEKGFNRIESASPKAIGVITAFFDPHSKIWCQFFSNVFKNALYALVFNAGASLVMGNPNHYLPCV